MIRGQVAGHSKINKQLRDCSYVSYTVQGDLIIHIRCIEALANEQGNVVMMWLDVALDVYLHFLRLGIKLYSKTQ